jgi:hypothetical protein
MYQRVTSTSYISLTVVESLAFDTTNFGELLLLMNFIATMLLFAIYAIFGYLTLKEIN